MAVSGKLYVAAEPERIREYEPGRFHPLRPSDAVIRPVEVNGQNEKNQLSNSNFGKSLQPHSPAFVLLLQIPDSRFQKFRQALASRCTALRSCGKKFDEKLRTKG